MMKIILRSIKNKGKTFKKKTVNKYKELRMSPAHIAGTHVPGRRERVGWLRDYSRLLSGVMLSDGNVDATHAPGKGGGLGSMPTSMCLQIMTVVMV